MANTASRLSPRWRILLPVLAAGATLVVVEIAARIWVAWKWPRERIELLTTHSAARGRFASHPNLPFVLNPAWSGHNSAGFRGPEIALAKAPGVRRVACIGASTTYGLYVEPEQAHPEQLCALLRERHGQWEAINAGVPGWVSTEMLISLHLRVLPYQPDVVVILEGRNETFPQAYNDFRPDYTHFRRPGFNFVVSNYGHKEVFRWSHAAMVLCTVRGSRLGWSERAEHPLYGGMLWENRPSFAQAARNFEDPARLATWQANLEHMIALCRARGIVVLVCTLGFRSDKLALDELEPAAGLADLLDRQVARNNEIAREVAQRMGAGLVESAGLKDRADLFHDDCHMNAEGHRLRARMIFDVLAAELAGR